MPATVERAIKCLALIEASASGSTISELAAQLSTSVPSVSRLVQTLRKADLVTRDANTGRLQVGLGLWELGSAAVARLTVRRVALPLIAPAIPELGRPVNFAIPRPNRVLFVDRLESIGGVVVSTPLGLSNDYHVAAVGKAMLAYSPPEFVREVANAGLRKRTESTITDLEVLLAELEGVRETGVAVTREERRGNAYGLGAPILDASGRAVAALGMQVTEVDADPRSALARELSRVAMSVSYHLGYLQDLKNSLT